jgi:hypothetical protein
LTFMNIQNASAGTIRAGDKVRQACAVTSRRTP